MIISYNNYDCAIVKFPLKFPMPRDYLGTCEDYDKVRLPNHLAISQ